LFRSEVVNSRFDHLSGNIAIVVPVAWQAIGYMIFCGTTVALTLLSFASYARVEMVSGVIVPDKGISNILPTRIGVIMALTVKEGQEVAAGAELATIRAEEDSASELSPAAQIEAAVGRQDASLAAQMVASSSAAGAQMRQLAAQRSGLTAEIGQLQSQMTIQRDLIASAQKDYDRARTVAERGFISLRDLQVREETLLARQQGQSQLAQSLAVKQSALSEAERNGAQIAAQSQVQNAGLAAARAEVAQQAASAAGSRSYVLRAPVAGRVTALTARVGQPASAGTPLMTIVPAGSVLRAELAVSSAAIGFVKPGQQVRLAIDAFPYQRFGTVSGKVLTVAASAVSAQGPNGSTVAVYPVTVALDKTRVTAFGRQEPLV
jgi:membrane fusion protein